MPSETERITHEIYDHHMQAVCLGQQAEAHDKVAADESMPFEIRQQSIVNGWECREQQKEVIVEGFRHKGEYVLATVLKPTLNISHREWRGSGFVIAMLIEAFIVAMILFGTWTWRVMQ